MNRYKVGGQRVQSKIYGENLGGETVGNINRVAHVQADYMFLIVRPSAGWSPQCPEDVPHQAEVLSVDYVAGFEEAREEMLRCNRLAIRRGLDKWAVVRSGGGEL